MLAAGLGRGAGPLTKQLPAHEAVIEVLCPPSGPSLPLEALRMTKSSSEYPTGTQQNRHVWTVWGSYWRRVCVMAQQQTKDEQSLRSLGSEDPVRWPHGWLSRHVVCGDSASRYGAYEPSLPQPTPTRLLISAET